jgi:hypothetical protein
MKLGEVDIVVIVDGKAECYAVQRLVFELGFLWNGHYKQGLQYFGSKYLFLQTNMRISHAYHESCIDNETIFTYKQFKALMTRKDKIDNLLSDDR